MYVNSTMMLTMGTPIKGSKHKFCVRNKEEGGRGQKPRLSAEDSKTDKLFHV